MSLFDRSRRKKGGHDDMTRTAEAMQSDAAVAVAEREETEAAAEEAEMAAEAAEAVAEADEEAAEIAEESIGAVDEAGESAEGSTEALDEAVKATEANEIPAEEADEAIKAAEEAAEAEAQAEETGEENGAEPSDNAEAAEADENTEGDRVDVAEADGSDEADADETDETDADEADEAIETAPAAMPLGLRILLGALKTVGLLVLVLVILAAAGAGYLLYYTAEKTVEIGQPVTMQELERLPHSEFLCSPREPLSRIDTTRVGQRKAEFTMFGFLPWEMTVTVQDTVRPILSLRPVVAAMDTLPEPEDFVDSWQDASDVSFSFAVAPNMKKRGEQRIMIIAKDAGGNMTTVETSFTVQREGLSRTVELTVSRDEIFAALSGEFVLTEIGEPYAAADGVGESYRVTACKEGEETRYIFTLTLCDTAAPTGVSVDMDWFAGRELRPEQLVAAVMDYSPVTFRFVTEPDHTLRTRQPVTVAVTDAWGNETEFQSSVRFWDIPATATVEAGTSKESLEGYLFENSEILELIGYQEAKHTVGEHIIAAMGELTALPITLTVVDTVPPTATAQAAVTYIGHLPLPRVFCAQVTDGSTVIYAYLIEPDVSKEGTVPVTVTVTDGGGNSVTLESTLDVVPDTEAPIFAGLGDIYITEGGTATYRKGVSAIDNADGEVAFTVDASAVDTKTAGRYPVVYSATDKAGNRAEMTVTAIVGSVGQESVDAMCDQILASIITEGMTETERAEAIYQWCVSHIRYSTSTSHLMGQYLPAAYSGLTIHSGNCYTYYAVCAALMTRSGLTNAMLQRDSVSNPHYWNLVKIDGTWYHVDTCPQYPGYEIRAFLLTNEDLMEYNRTKVPGYYSFDTSLLPVD